MKIVAVENLNITEKLRLLCCEGWWNTVSFDDKLPTVEVADGPLGLRKGRTNEKGEPFCPKSIFYASEQLLANTWNEQLAYLLGECLADDCKEEKIDILLAPGVNIKRHPLNGRNFEYFSEDPLLAGKLAKSYIEGLQSQGVGACVKHFCCNNLEYNRFEQSSEVDERTLREIYYLPFEIACEAKPVSLMSSYNRVNGKYASEYEKGFKVLRNEFGFDGVIYSDWEAVRNRTASAKAGLDIEFPYNDDHYQQLVKDFKDGKITEEEVNACVQRILNMIYRCKQMQKGRTVLRTQEDRLKTARTIAEEGIVLLKNEDKILPIKKEITVAVSGCYATPEKEMIAGEGSSKVESVADGWNLPELLKKELNSEILYEPMFWYDRVSGAAFKWTARPYQGKINAAKSQISIICVGTGGMFETEAADRRDMKLPEVQERAILDLASVNQNTVVVIFAGSPIDVSAWEDKVKAIVYASFCGCQGINALSDILCGKVNPSGKLSETFPVSFNRTTVAHSYIDTMVTKYSEGLDVGYRYFDRHKEDIRYPFGYGLSYSSFEYKNLKVTGKGTKLKINFDISNNSAVDGKEIVQVYIRESSPVVYRPEKELKSFSKVFVKANETVSVNIELNDRSFAYYSVADEKWLVCGGMYEILIGASSQDIRLKQMIEIK